MILPTSSAKTAQKATIFYAVLLGVLFCQIGSASASCMTSLGCSTSGSNYDCSTSITMGGQQYCCCNNLGYSCSSSSDCPFYGGGSSGSPSGSSQRPPPPSPLPPPPGRTSCTPPPSWCSDGVSTCDTRSSLSQSLVCNYVSYGCCCSGTYAGSLCEECATGSCPSRYSSPSSSPSSSTSGNIVGIVVGALVGFGALAGIVTAVICMNQKKEVTPAPSSPLPVAQPVQVAQPMQAQSMPAHFAAA